MYKIVIIEEYALCKLHDDRRDLSLVSRAVCRKIAVEAIAIQPIITFGVCSYQTLHVAVTNC